MSLILHTNTFLVETVAQGLPSTVYLTGVVCKLLRQPEGWTQKVASADFPIIEKPYMHNNIRINLVVH